MSLVMRRLLMLLLLVSLPVQGWAATRMAITMAMEHRSPTVMAAHHHTAAPDASHAAPADHGPQCCDSHDSAPGAEGGHASCGESCHCCISTAPPTMELQLCVQPPPALWQGHKSCAFAQATVHAPDKPPKG